MTIKELKKYPKAKLTACGQHPEGCYINLDGKENNVDSSKETKVLLDFDEDKRERIQHEIDMIKDAWKKIFGRDR